MTHQDILDRIRESDEAYAEVMKKIEATRREQLDSIRKACGGLGLGHLFAPSIFIPGSFRCVVCGEPRSDS